MRLAEWQVFLFYMLLYFVYVLDIIGDEGGGFDASKSH
jgi:hypothetical protein